MAATLSLQDPDAKKSPANPNPRPGQLEPNEYVIWTYVGARAGHFLAYVTAQLHDIRAAFWSVSSVAVLGMVGYTIAKIAST